MPRLQIGDFPSQGRIGRATGGPSAGDYIFVFPELDGRWGYYTSSGGDDIVPRELAELWIAESEVDWVDESEDSAIEMEFFRLRPIVMSQYDRPHAIRAWVRRIGRSRSSREAAIRIWERRLRAHR